MTDLFYKDIKTGEFISWDNLINDIRCTLSFNLYCKSDNYYEIFKHIIISLIYGKKIVLLDSDFSDDELENLIGTNQLEDKIEFFQNSKLSLPENKSELLEKLKNVDESWSITLFTSGTTGVPKKITHSIRTLTRFIRVSLNNSKCIWGFAYNPTHFAGVQVFFQALMNGNTIIRLFGLAPCEVYREIKEYGITHISSTPTFYKLLLPSEEKFYSVIRVTTGGEKFSESTMTQISKAFPNSKITNVYASTEAGTLFASENEVFSIKPQLKHLIRLVNDEILIHSSLMGDAELEYQEWYSTGDLVEIISNEPIKFRFISRKNEMINVGGYKVNPHEVEETILGIGGIRNVRVFSKENSILGNIICCEVVCDKNQISESSIRIHLQSKLQEFKIPRIIYFVDKLSSSRTGKTKRN